MIVPIIWVPGNHEPYKSFQENSTEIIPESLNLHKKYKKLSNDLYLIGIGGSTPILNGNKYNPDMIPFKSLDFKNIKYEGYPYNVDNTSENYIKSDLILSKDLQDVIDKFKKKPFSLTKISPKFLLPKYNTSPSITKTLVQV